MIIKRERYLKKIRPFYEADLIKVLTGVRRSGKSVLLNQIEEEILLMGASKNKIIKINFEDIDFIELDNAEKLSKYIDSKISRQGRYYIFLDEIQHVKKFEIALASLRVKYNCSIFVTGSNSKILSGSMGTLLVGRCVEFKILPFSYKEACEYLEMDGQIINYDQFIFDYIKYGGLPLRFSFFDQSAIETYLTQTFNHILDRDVIVGKSKIDREKFIHLARYVMAYAGEDFSIKNVEKFFIEQNYDKIDKKQIYRYLDRMEKACLIDRVKKFRILGKETMRYIEKQYAVDTGLRLVNTNFINFENTFYLENVIYNELINRGYKVFTGKTYNGEIDFVVVKNQKKCFIQVAYYLLEKSTIEREFGAFKTIKDSSPKYVLSLDRFDYSRDGIKHLNIVDFLLEKEDIFLT